MVTQIKKRDGRKEPFCKGKIIDGLRFSQDSVLRGLIAAERPSLPMPEMEQLSLFG